MTAEESYMVKLPAEDFPGCPPKARDYASYVRQKEFAS